MLKSHRYPVPETFLSGPLNSCLDFNLRDSSINVISNSDYVVPAPAQVSTPTDLAALFPVEEPDFSGIPSVHLPSSTTPSRCSTLLMDEQQAPGPQTTDSEVGNVLPPSPLEATAVQPPTVASTPEGRPTLSLFSDADVGNRLPPVLLEEFAMTPAPANSSETGSDPPRVTSGVASTQPLPLAIVAPQMSAPPTVSDAETEAAVASILPEVEFESSTSTTFATFLEDSVESPAAQVTEDTVLLEVPADFLAEPYVPVEPTPSVQQTEEDPTDPVAFFHGAPSQWDDSPTGRILQEARARAMQGEQNGYRVQFSAIHRTQVTKEEYYKAPNGEEYSLISTWVI